MSVKVKPDNKDIANWAKWSHDGDYQLVKSTQSFSLAVSMFTRVGGANQSESEFFIDP